MSRRVVLIDIDGEMVSVGPVAKDETIDKIREAGEGAGGTACGQARHVSVAEFMTWMKQRGAS